MALIYNEEQQQLKNTAAEFIQSSSPVGALRALRDTEDVLGYDKTLWEKIVQLGWSAIIIPEQYNGLNFGFTGLGAILEETGKTLMASPLLSTVVLGTSTLILGGSELQKNQLLPAIANGEITTALALEEHNHHNPTNLQLQAIQSATGFTLNGKKVFVLDGHSADKIIVVAVTNPEGTVKYKFTLFLVDIEQQGITCHKTRTIDSRNTATIEFDHAHVTHSNIIGEKNKGWDILEPVLDHGRIGLAAEMLGSAQACFDSTIAYLKEREQFGVKIGSFQALKHRAAKMYIELELSRSVVMDALSAIDENRQDITQIASLAKARLNETFHLISNEAVQMHGGIGVTDELDIGLFLKRSRVATQILGDTGYHKDRYASLCGY